MCVFFKEINKQEGKSILEKWFNENKENPYPSNETKHLLATLTAKTYNQVDSWFIKKRQELKKSNKSFYKHISPDQKKVLISFLDKINCTPGKQDIQLIIERSGLTKRQIINWYFYHRTKKNTE